MNKFIFNNTNEELNVRGVLIPSKDFYAIPENLVLSWANDVNVNLMIISGDLIVSVDGVNKIEDVVTALNYFKGITANVKVESMPQSNPFARKVLDCGGKLYRRKRGIRQICAGNSDTIISYIIPYTKCKIDEIEIINCSGNDCGDFIVKDSISGTYSGVPNKILNQFGFDVCFSDLYYSDSSQYDAELYQGMQVEIVYKNKETDSKNIGINLTLHEIIYT